MNLNRKHKSKDKPVTLSANMIKILKNHYMILSERLKAADAYAQDPDEEPTVKPLEYAFMCGQLAELEGLLKYAGAIKEEELFQSDLITKKDGEAHD